MQQTCFTRGGQGVTLSLKPPATGCLTPQPTLQHPVTTPACTMPPSISVFGCRLRCRALTATLNKNYTLQWYTDGEKHVSPSLYAFAESAGDRGKHPWQVVYTSNRTPLIELRREVMRRQEVKAD